MASCLQFGSFDGRTQGGFKKLALGCIFYKAGPGLPEDIRPGGDEKKKRPQGGFSKPALGCLFHKAGPGLPRDRRPGDDDGKKRPQGDSKKPAMGCLFKWPVLVCLEICNPVMAKKETGPKAAFESRRWVAFFIKPALVCLETGELGRG